MPAAVLSRLVALALAGLAVPPAIGPAAAQQAVLVERLAEVGVTWAGDSLLVIAAGWVPLSGFSGPALRARPDLVKTAGGLVLDFVAAPPRLEAGTKPAETKLIASYRIAPDAVAGLRFIQVRAAAGSRAVQVPATP